LRRGTPYHPYLTGGSHEGGRRAGTHNVPGIVGMAKALALCEGERESEMARLRQLRDRIIGQTLESVPGVRLTGSHTKRLANHASFTIRDVEAEGILIALDLEGFAASSGSACTSARQKPSHVLEAVGVPVEELAGGLRISLGYSNNVQQIELLLQTLPRIIERHRQSIPAPI